jgi:Holliday junction DNA helicase RuvA
MYDFLRGTVISVDTADRMSVEVNGVGYLLRVSKLTRAAIPLDGKPTLIYVRLVVRDDDLILFGFHDIAERVCFDLLTSVQGVGPVMAMAILGAVNPPALKALLVAKNSKDLAKIKGVGPKSSERIVVELAAKADKIPCTDGGPVVDISGIAEEKAQAKRGLVALGFAAKDAAVAVDKVTDTVGGPSNASDILRAALAVLR